MHAPTGERRRCHNCNLPIIDRWQHCTGLQCEGIVWCPNCVPHSTYTGFAVALGGIGHP